MRVPTPHTSLLSTRALAAWQAGTWSWSWSWIQASPAKTSQYKEAARQQAHFNRAGSPHKAINAAEGENPLDTQHTKN